MHPSRVAGNLVWSEADQAVGNVRNDYAELMGQAG